MKTKKTGIALMVIGIILLVFAAFNYESFLNADDASNNATKKNTEKPFQWSPVIGLALLVGGIVVIDPEKNIRY
jgi:uncharacterized membrane protein YdcZ (DUF606 family)